MPRALPVPTDVALDIARRRADGRAALAGRSRRLRDCCIEFFCTEWQSLFMWTDVDPRLRHHFDGTDRILCEACARGA